MAEEEKDLQEETEPKTPEEMMKASPNPHKESGMFSVIKDFLPEGDDESSDGEEVEIEFEDQELKDKFENFTQEDKERWTEEDLEQFNLSDDLKTKIMEKYSDKFKKSEDDLGAKLEDMETPQLVEEVKKNQRLVSERNAKIEELESALAKAKENGGGEANPEMEKFLKELNVDFVGAFEKYKDKLNLPDMDIVSAQLNTGGVTARVKQWQENSLRKEIEEQFGLEEGEFEYDPADASKAGTASYEWNERTDAYRQELRNKQVALRQKEAENLKRIEDQQAKDLKWYADTYFEGDQSKVKGLLDTMNDTQLKVTKGEETPDKHPFSLRNLMRGFYHEDLTRRAVEKAVSDLKAQYAEKGMYLKGDTEEPTDVTRIKSPPGKDSGVLEVSKEAISNSPMLQNISSMIK